MGTAIRLMDPAQDEFLAQLEKKSGKPNHFYRTMANRPEVLKNFVPLYASIVGPGLVERRLKELIYLSVSFANECAYCSAAHTAPHPDLRLHTSVRAARQRSPETGQRFLG